MKRFTPITARDLVLFATNTGELYETHKTMARTNASFGDWIMHVSVTVMNLYARQVEPCCASLVERRQAADELKAYYERHVEDLEDTP